MVNGESNENLRSPLFIYLFIINKKKNKWSCWYYYAYIVIIFVCARIIIRTNNFFWFENVQNLYWHFSMYLHMWISFLLEEYCLLTHVNSSTSPSLGVPLSCFSFSIFLWIISYWHPYKTCRRKRLIFPLRFLSYPC